MSATFTTLCLCWRITRPDGVIMGFTAHDRVLALADGTYVPVPGFSASSLSASSALDVDNLEFRAALSHASISRADLSAGRYDSAQLDVFLADWQTPGAPAIHLARFLLGDIDVSSATLTAQARGEAQALDRALVETLSPECRASLGDARCKVPMRSYQRITQVIAVLDDAQLRLATAPPGDDYYIYGRLRFLSSANAGFESRIVAVQGPVFTLEDAPPVAVMPGALVQIAAGCDKRFATCQAKFNNRHNFRGEPFVPGIDALLRYPGL